MIFLQQIRLECFKGIKDLTCDFDDLCVLAGLNNSGKTSVLQAIYLLCSVLPTLASHPHLANSDIKTRTVDLNTPIGRLGLPNVEWLRQDTETLFRLSATFWAQCSVQIEMIERGRIGFTVTSQTDTTDEGRLKILLHSLQDIQAEFFRPPGMVSPRETMIGPVDYRNQVAAGQGNQLWRNAIWWQMQETGPEAFEPVRELVHQHFPDIDLRHPTLGLDANPPPVLLKYQENKERPVLDIAQSGAGLHTFLSLAQLIQKSTASILLLDEPDAHLHASQQARVLELLTDVALSGKRQVIIATHAPEIISRVPSESIRWLARGSTRAEGGIDSAALLDRLGVSSDVYLSKTDFPQVIVYVEGDQDKPVVEGIIDRCRRQDPELPSTRVIRHKNGKFSAIALQAIARVTAEMELKTRVVGIRDLDWDYGEYKSLPPPDHIERQQDDNYVLLTLPCKELENLLCDPEMLFEAVEGHVTQERLAQIVDEESGAPELVSSLRHNAQPQIRDRYDSKLASHSKEKKAEKEFALWADSAMLRRRLVSGKGLLARIRNRVKQEYNQQIPAAKIIVQKGLQIKGTWLTIASALFPGHFSES